MKEKDTVVVKCKCHWICLILPCVLCLLFVLSALGHLIGADYSSALSMLIVACVFALWACVRYFRSSLVLTETAVIGRIGIIKTRKLTSPISKIQDVSISNGLWGKLFRYHTVTISTAGSGITEYVFAKVTNGNKFQREFLARTK